MFYDNFLCPINYKEFTLLSLENTIKYNYVLLKNISKNLYSNLNIVYSRIQYNNYRMYMKILGEFLQKVQKVTVCSGTSLQKC